LRLRRGKSGFSSGKMANCLVLIYLFFIPYDFEHKGELFKTENDN